MKTLFLYFIALLCLSPLSLRAALPLPTDHSQKAKPATIKVLLAKLAKEALVEVRGLHDIYNPQNDLLILSGAFNKRDRLFSSNEGIKWGELFPGLFQIRIVPAQSDTSILVNGIQYHGCIEIYCIAGTINIVNEIDIESYLKSSLAAQFPKPMHNEVLDAIAIVARTHAYYTAARNPNSSWHVDFEQSHYQGYGLTFQNRAIDEAVERTRHCILTYRNSPFAALWTENSAGRTAAFSTIFRRSTVTPDGVIAPPAQKVREKHSWTFSITKEQLAALIELTDIKEIDLYQDKSSGKVYALRLSDGFSTKNIDFSHIQELLGKKQLLSNDFSLTVQGEKITFKGFGSGSGVGLCLYSASDMAKKQQKADAILATFFPGTELVKRRAFEESN